MFNIPYGKHNINEDDVASVRDALLSDYITQGPLVPKFEESVNEKVNSKFSVAVNSATSALHIACLALGLQKGDIVWTSPITFVASANCARYCNAEIDFVDINEYGLLCCEALENKLKIAKNNNVLPKIVIPVHLSGASCDMERIFKLSIKYGFHIIEDASHAIGGEYKGLKVGSCKFSDITIFSFHPVKIITTAEGGIATTNDKNLAYKMKLLSSHGITKNKNDFEFSNKGIWHYEQHFLGFNYRMNELQAALGISQIKRLEKIIEERNTLYNFYKNAFKESKISFLAIPSDVKSAVHLGIIKIKSNFHKDLFENLRESGVGVQLHYEPVHLQPYYRNLGFKEGDFPISENYSKTSISIPLYPGLKRSDQINIIKKIEEIFKNISF